MQPYFHFNYIILNPRPFTRYVKNDQFVPRSKIFTYFNQSSLTKRKYSSKHVFRHIFIGLHILSTAVAYLCVTAVQHFLNDPHSEIIIGNFPVVDHLIQ